MGQLSIFGLVATVALSQVSSPPPSVKALLNEVQGLIGRVESPTQKVVVYLTYAQALERAGDRDRALKALRAGWAVHQNPGTRPHVEGEAYDAQRLLDTGDLATLPVTYAYEFVVVGDILDAHRAAMSLGESPLADAFRGGLGDQLKVRYPQFVEVVTLTDRQRDDRLARKNKVLAGIPAIRAESDLPTRVGELREAADELTLLDGNQAALPLLREAAATTNQLTDAKWRAIYDAEIADVLWRVEAKGEAFELVLKADSELKAVGGPKEKLEARFYIEQTKRSMGLPNEFMEVLHERDPGSPAPPAGGEIPAASKVFPNAPDLIARGLRQLQKGDVAGAKRTLAARARQIIAGLHPEPYVNREAVMSLQQVAINQKVIGDKAGAKVTLQDGFHRLAGTERWAKMTQLTIGPGAGKSRTITRDQQSPVLRVGAVTMAKLGFFPEAIAMAHSIQDPAQRAVAIAGAVREAWPFRM